MGHLDTHMIDYFDSDQQLKVPKQPWMKARLDKDYWVKGTQSRQSKQQWFKVNIGILMDRLKQNKTSGQHVLQLQHGCEGETQPGGTLKFSTGVDMYSYDGNDFLSFDNSNSAWVAGAPAAQQTKRTWDGVDKLKEYTKVYLEKECMEWMGKFLTYQGRVLENAKKPEVYLFASKAKVEAHVILTCMATDFYPKDIELWIKRDGRVLRREDGVMSSGSRPNGDETFQRRDWVEILKTDQSQYTCEVIHEATQVNITKEWDGKLPESGSPIGVVVGVLGLLVLVLAVVAGVLIFLHRRGRICQLTCKKKGSNDPMKPTVYTSSSGSSGSASTTSSISSTSSTSSSNT
ncbi:RLA class I histocompatibility antigen, alpha chain 11/11-like isoform X2 [Gasterosteus aculeatus]